MRFSISCVKGYSSAPEQIPVLIVTVSHLSGQFSPLLSDQINNSNYVGSTSKHFQWLTMSTDTYVRTYLIVVGFFFRDSDEEIIDDGRAVAGVALTANIRLQYDNIGMDPAFGAQITFELPDGFSQLRPVSPPCSLVCVFIHHQ
jgi:hypothetical protein